jgi:hypothetical protein
MGWSVLSCNNGKTARKARVSEAIPKGIAPVPKALDRAKITVAEFEKFNRRWQIPSCQQQIATKNYLNFKIC